MLSKRILHTILRVGYEQYIIFIYLLHFNTYMEINIQLINYLSVETNLIH